MQSDHPSINGQDSGLFTPGSVALDDVGPVGAMLREHGRERFSGVLRISGSPGGTVFLREGLIIGAATPASPGPESLLLRSGRVSEEAWNQAFTAGAPSGHLAVELVRQSAVGAAGLEVVCISAVFDAVFAMELFGVDGCEHEPTGPNAPLPPLPVLPGLPVERVVRELSRRMAMTTAWREIGITAQCRPVPVQPIAPTALQVEQVRHDVLLKSNGRRTPRDIAFVLGRGLYVVMQEVVSLVEAGLLDPSPVAQRKADTLKGDPPPNSSALPRRQRGASAVTKVPPPPARHPWLEPRIPPDLTLGPEENFE